MKFFKVTDEKVKAAMEGYFAQYQSAFDAMLKFSRKHGGSRSRIGMSHGFGQCRAAIIFSKGPDRDVWKRTLDKTGNYWVPKATKAAAEIKKEFDSLLSAFPTKWDVYKPLNYEPFGNGFVNFSKYGEVWVIGMGDDFKPNKKQQKQLERISDVEYETMLAKTNKS